MTRTHSSPCSWTGFSKQIADIVLFWLRLSERYACRPIQVSCFYSSPIKDFGNEKLLTPSLFPLSCQPFVVNRPNLHILTEPGVSHIFDSNWPTSKQEKKYCARVRSPNSKIMNRRIIDFNILE